VYGVHLSRGEDEAEFERGPRRSTPAARLCLSDPVHLGASRNAVVLVRAGSHGIGDRWSSPGTSGHGRHARIPGHSTYTPRTKEAGASRRWVRTPRGTHQGPSYASSTGARRSSARCCGRSPGGSRRHRVTPRWPRWVIHGNAVVPVPGDHSLRENFEAVAAAVELGFPASSRRRRRLRASWGWTPSRPRPRAGR